MLPVGSQPTGRKEKRLFTKKNFSIPLSGRAGARGTVFFRELPNLDPASLNALFWAFPSHAPEQGPNPDPALGRSQHSPT